MKKRIISLMLVLTMMVGMVPAFAVNVGAFDISQLEGGALYHTSANFGRLMNNKNIFTAHYLGAGYSNEASIDSRLRNRSSSMVYEHIATIERENLGRVVFDTLWSIASVDLDRFSGVTEVELYTAVLWGMLTGQIDSKVPSVESTVEDLTSVVTGATMEFAEYVVTQGVLDDTAQDAKKVLEKLKIEDDSMLERVHIWYGDHYSSIGEEIENVKSAFKNIEEVAKIGNTVAKFCDSAYEYITKMNQIEALYGESHTAYLEFLTKLSNVDSATHLIKEAANNLISIMDCASYEEAMKASIIDLVCQDGIELGLEKVSDIIKDTVEGLFDKAISNSIASSALTGIKIGMELADALLGVEDKLAVRYNILLLSDMTNAIFDASETLRKEYYVQLYEALSIYANSNSLDANLSLTADAYVASIEMCHRFLLQTNTYARQYINENYNDWWNQTRETFIAYKKVLDEEVNGLKTSYKNAKNLSDEYYWKFYEQVVNYVIFSADGWENTPAPIVKEFLVNITIPDAVPTKSGYIFKYWVDYTNNQIYYPGDIFNKNYSEDVVLTPHFDRQDTITYNANGGIGAPTSHENTVGSTTLSTTVPTRNGHTFLGWDENPNAKEPTYPKKTDGSAITIDKEGNITLYAIWQPKIFNIIFDANGGVFTAYDNATTVTRPKVYAQNFTFDVTYPVRDGYKCIGWSLENDNTVDWTNGETENDIGAANANDKRVYAVWVDTTVDVMYDYNDGSGKTDMVSVDIQNSNTHTIQEPINAKESLKNYFKGWMYQDPNGKHWWASDNNDLGKVTVVQPGNQLLLSNDITLYAKWDYYVHYNDGNVFTHDVVRDGNGYVIDAPLHTPSGKEFKSWKGEDANGNVAYYKAGDTINLTTDWTLTATWSDGSTVESYVTVSYDANGGRGSIADDEVIAGGKVTLDDGSSFYRSGYEFVGWAEQPNAVSRDYRGGARITVDENITLYAVWKAVSDETIATVTMSADKEIYEPGDTIIITVLANNTDHFYIDADSAKFNVLRQDGSTIHTGGVFVEKNAPTLMFPNNRYRNGREYEVELYIPKNCSDGTYTVSVKATDSVLNEHGNGNVDGQAAKIAEYSINIVVEDGYKDKVTVNINKSKVTLHIDDVDTLKATITPSSAKRNLEWYSSNESIVTVTEKSNQKGRIVATGYGTATITADVNGIKDMCTVVVERCTYDQKEVDAEFLKTPATCSSYAVYYKSCECGYHGSSTFTYSEGGYAQHSYINHKCACGEIEYMSVTFMNGESQWHKIEAQYNSSLNLAQMTVPEAAKGYVFAGWYTENGTRIAEGFTVAENIIAHAKFVAGDADGNGRIEKSDSNMIIRYILGEKNGVVDDKNALDINKDGKVTIVDAIKVLLYLSGKTDALD